MDIDLQYIAMLYFSALGMLKLDDSLVGQLTDIDPLLILLNHIYAKPVAMI